MQSIQQTYIMEAPVAKVWDALVNEKTIVKWGGGPAKMDDKVGTKFTLWGGDIHGKNLEVVKNKKLVQDWFGGDWAEPSKVTFTLIPAGVRTKVTLLQENIPDDEAEETDDGWRQFYLGAIQQFFDPM